MKTSTQSDNAHSGFDQSNRMDVLHVVESFATGVLSYLQELTQATPRYQHTILYAQHEDTPAQVSDLFPHNTTLIKLTGLRRSLLPHHALRASWRLFREFTKRQWSVIHLHSTFAGYWGQPALFAMRRGQHAVWTPHGSVLSMPRARWKHALLRAIERGLSLSRTTIIACSPSEAQSLHDYGLSCTCIANACRKPSITAPTAFAAPPNDLTILAIGRTSLQKRPDRFARLAQAHQATTNATRWTWVGDGQSRATLEQAGVTVTGWLDRSEALKLIADSDIVCSTSDYEGLSIAMLEALALGKPLLLSDCIGNKDLVAHGWNGWLFSTDDQALQALKNISSATINAMGLRSRLLHQHRYTIAHMVQSTQRLYSNRAQAYRQASA